MKKYLPAIIWMIFIFFLSSRSTTGVFSDDPLWRILIFKYLHLIEYAILGSLIIMANQKVRLTILIGYLYACTDEVHQLFVPGRTGKITDTLVDLIGIIIGIFIIKKLISLPCLPADKKAPTSGHI